MVKVATENTTSVFYCEVCGFGYEDSSTAEECENFCTVNGACSLEITGRAVRKPKF